MYQSARVAFRRGTNEADDAIGRRGREWASVNVRSPPPRLASPRRASLLVRQRTCPEYNETAADVLSV